MKNKKISFYSNISTHLKNIISKQAASSHKKQNKKQKREISSFRHL